MEDTRVTFWKFFEKFIQERAANPEYSRSSISIYRNCFSHIKAFAETTRRPVDFEHFDYAFFADFTNYLFTKNFGKNYVHKITSTLKTVLKESERREVSPLLRFKSV